MPAGSILLPIGASILTLIDAPLLRALASLVIGFGMDQWRQSSAGSAVGVVLTLGAGAGLANGLAVTSLRINPFIGPLATTMVLRGASLTISDSQTITGQETHGSEGSLTIRCLASRSQRPYLW